MESLGIMMTFILYDVKQKTLKGLLIGRFVAFISDILWSSCFESYEPKDSR